MNLLKSTSIFFLLGALLSQFLGSCTSHIDRNNNQTNKDFVVEDFSKIKIQGGYNVELVQGDSASVKVYASKQVINKVDVSCNDGILHISTGLHNVSTEEIKLLITFKSIDELRVEGGVNLDTKGILKLKKLDINVQGGANINMNIEAEEITAYGQGGMNMNFVGKADKFYATTEGAGNIDADNLEARYVDCHVAGVGNASVYATGELHAKVEGVGKIGYRGNPEIYKEVNGIGMVYRK